VFQQKHCIAILTLLCFCGICNSNISAKDDPLEPLNRRVGTWDAEITLKKAAWTPSEIKSAGQTKVQWVLGDTFIENNSNFASIDSESLELVNYDSKDGVYRSWNFSKATFPRGETTGNWDAKSNTLNWKADYGYGYAGKGHWKFTGEDTMDWAFTVTSPTGELLLDMEGTDTRTQ
jgi:hypothetical protein